MSDSTVRLALHRLGEYVGPGGAVKCIWHGGEPLLRGHRFFEDVLTEQAKLRGVTFTNGIQTNGTLLTDSFLRFAHDSSIGLSLSIDGPAFLHDRYRSGSDHKATLGKTLRFIKERGGDIVKDGRPALGAICTVTKDTLPYAQELYEFFRSLPLSLKFHPAITTDARYTPAPEQYAEFLKTICDFWLDDEGSTVVMSTFEDIFSGVAGFPPTECIWVSSCQRSMLAVDTDGTVYPCCRSIGLEPFRYGSLIEQSLEDLLCCDRRHQLLRRKPRECTECKFNAMCSGGCFMHSHELAAGHMQKDPFCETYRQLFQYAEDRLSQEIA